ncbi:hypothetical protein WMF30_40275 [Sorangium sp. So ce134]
MRSYRLTLGRRFNEGARLTWLALRRLGWSQADLRRRVKAYPGELPKVLYGDKLPTLQLAADLQDLLKVPVKAWNQPPTEPFVPPARAAIEAELAANPLPPPAA